MVCLKSQVSANVANSATANCGPLSVTKMSGIPYRANTAFISLMTARDVVVVSRATSI